MRKIDNIPFFLGVFLVMYFLTLGVLTLLQHSTLFSPEFSIEQSDTGIRIMCAGAALVATIERIFKQYFG